MVEPFLGEIRMFGGNYAPRNWALCAGQLLAIAEYQALFSIVGTAFGGDGRSSFGMPDLRGRIPVHQGTGIGLTPRARGAKYGYERIILSANQIPTHNHPMEVSGDAPDYSQPTGRVLGTPTDPTTTIYTDPAQEPSPAVVELADAAVTTAGSSQSHQNMMPSSCIQFIVALHGIFPSRN